MSPLSDSSPSGLHMYSASVADSQIWDQLAVWPMYDDSAGRVAVRPATQGLGLSPNPSRPKIGLRRVAGRVGSSARKLARGKMRELALTPGRKRARSCSPAATTTTRDDIDRGKKKQRVDTPVSQSDLPVSSPLWMHSAMTGSNSSAPKDYMRACVDGAHADVSDASLLEIQYHTALPSPVGDRYLSPAPLPYSSPSMGAPADAASRRSLSMSLSDDVSETSHPVYTTAGWARAHAESRRNSSMSLWDDMSEPTHPVYATAGWAGVADYAHQHDVSSPSRLSQELTAPAFTSVAAPAADTDLRNGEGCAHCKDLEQRMDMLLSAMADVREEVNVLRHAMDSLGAKAESLSSSSTPAGCSLPGVSPDSRTTVQVRKNGSDYVVCIY
ncbi:hypothetical protein C8T65DRAFT_745296 [Cerioporus squamosus]|nr:hypothetical protein C8T65DRAFT_745296 [Cerioporus squamosus]